jgi:hypothetical protein
MVDRSIWEARYDERRDDGIRPPSQFLVAQRDRLPDRRQHHV